MSTVTKPLKSSEVEAADLIPVVQSRLQRNGLTSEPDQKHPVKSKLTDITQLLNTVNSLKDDESNEIQSENEFSVLNPSEVNAIQCGLESNGFKSPLSDVANGQLGFVDPTQPELGSNGVVASASVLPSNLSS